MKKILKEANALKEGDELPIKNDIFKNEESKDYNIIENESKIIHQ